MYVFLSGAEMQPERVRRAWPEARFVARGRLEPGPVGAVEAQDETWGIIVEIPQPAVSGDEQRAISDDGRPFMVVAPPGDTGDTAAVLAAARYWELPPAYVRRLAQAASTSSEAPSDG